jgi:hypothetical protein
MKGSDGLERHKTFKLITPHQETVTRESWYKNPEHTANSSQ